MRVLLSFVVLLRNFTSNVTACIISDNSSDVKNLIPTKQEFQVIFGRKMIDFMIHQIGPVSSHDFSKLK